MTIHHLGNQWLSLEGILVAKSSLRIGAATKVYLTSPAQLQVIRMKIGDQQIPYVPGSSLKGVLRSLCEKIARSTKLTPVSCYPYRNSCGEKYKEELEKGVQKNDLGYVSETIDKFCITCKMFGTLGFAGNITLFDAHPHGRIQVGVREGVAISRVDGGVAHGPFVIEYVSEGSKFRFKALSKNLPDYCIGLLCTALNEINSGRAFVGGMKSRGFGKSEILLSEVRSSEGVTKKSKSRDEGDMRDFTKTIIDRYKTSWSKHVESQK